MLFVYVITKSSRKDVGGVSDAPLYETEEIPRTSQSGEQTLIEFI